MRLVEILRRYYSFCKDFDDFKMISQKADNEGRMLRVLSGEVHGKNMEKWKRSIKNKKCICKSQIEGLAKLKV